MPIDIVGRSARATSMFAPLVPINDTFNDMDGFALTRSAIIFVGCQFNFDDCLILFVLDEKTGIVGTSQEGGLPSEAEADGAKDGGFAGTVGTDHDIQSGEEEERLDVCVCGTNERQLGMRETRERGGGGAICSHFDLPQNQ